MKWFNFQRRDGHSFFQKHLSDGSKAEELQKVQEQVQRLQKMDAVGRLAGGVAHDFNNLLAAINMYCDLISDPQANPKEIQENIREIKKVTERGANLTRQLLIFSRKQVVQYQSINISTSVSQMIKMLERLIPSSIKIISKLSNDLPTVRADIAQIEQVVMNLVVNARDAMPQGGEITIESTSSELGQDFTSTHLSTPPGRYVILTISDTGIGMDTETKTRIFEPFFTTKEMGKGTGLGLATVYGIVKQLKGSIWVYSEVGRGSIFKIYLPVENEQLVSEAPISVTKTRHSTGSERILLVEDEMRLRDLYFLILKRNGYKVVAAANGSEALEICRNSNEKIDLLLTDVVMPEMGGFELAENILKIHPNIKVIFMSGYTDQDFQEYLPLGEDLIFLQKPFDTNSLLGKIRETLSESEIQK